jgi:NADH dehydrogenase
VRCSGQATPYSARSPTSSACFLSLLIGGGRTRLQPVFVEDVAEAIARVLADPGTAGRTYELAGPGVYTLRELVQITLRLIGRRRLLLPVPFAVAQIQARLFELAQPAAHYQPGRLLRMDNLRGALPGFRDQHPAEAEDYRANPCRPLRTPGPG